MEMKEVLLAKAPGVGKGMLARWGRGRFPCSSPRCPSLPPRGVR